MKKAFSTAIAYFATAVSGVQTAVAVFPVALIAIVSLCFVFGIPCNAHEWYAACLFSIAACFAGKRPLSERAASAALFVFGIAAIYIIANSLTGPSGGRDMACCHHPAIRLMAAGWNPVHDSAFAEIAKTVPIPEGSFLKYHIISGLKGMWYFSAAALTFTGAQFNLALPAFVFMFAIAAFSIWRAMRTVPVAAKIAALSIVFTTVPDIWWIVDFSIALAATGLASEMYSKLSSERWNGISAFSCSFIMCTAKAPGIIHCAVFWAVFLVFSALKRKSALFPRVTVAKSAAAFAVLAALTLACHVSPFISSYRQYGHPLYPKYTADPVKYPAIDVTGDFLARNEDAKAMGHAGAWINAFVSSDAARAWYGFKTGKGSRFIPDVAAWSHSKHSEGSPTTAKYRLSFCLIAGILFFAGKRPERFIVLLLALGTIAMPTAMVGHRRYVPWVLTFSVFCIPAILAKIPEKWRNRTALAFLAAVGCVTIPAALVRFSFMADGMAATRKVFAAEPDCRIMAAYGPPEEHDNALSVLNAQLIKRATPEMSGTSIAVYPFDGFEFPANDPYNLRQIGDTSLAVCPGIDLTRFSRYIEIQKLENSKSRMLAYPWWILESVFVTFPANCALAVSSAFHAGK